MTGHPNITRLKTVPARTEIGGPRGGQRRIRCRDDGGASSPQCVTREHYDAYAAWRTERGDMDNMATISAQPYETAFFDYVQA